jgi:hypothetical protein
MNKEIEYTFLINVDVENRVVGEFYISRTLKLGKWNGEYLGSYCPINERKKFEIWKKENKDLCMEKPENAEIGDLYTHVSGVEFRWSGRNWVSEEAREKNKKAIADWRKTPEGRKSHRITDWKQGDEGAIFRDKAQEEEVHHYHSKATHCNNCEICELTHYPEPFSNATACFDHCHVSRLPRQIICQNCNSHEAYLKREKKWKKDDPNFTRFAIINDMDVYLS